MTHSTHAPLHPEPFFKFKSIFAYLLGTSRGMWGLLFVGLLLTFIAANIVAVLLESFRRRRIDSKVTSLAASGQRRPVPVTIITGFLGAGKTVLLNRLLANPNGRRICIIENEAGAVSIDHALVKEQDGSTTVGTGGSTRRDIVVLKNGCMCCSATGPGGELERTLDRLLQLREDAMASQASNDGSSSSGNVATMPFDHLVIELSGLADPSPIVETFLRPELSEHYALDGVVAVVDAKAIDYHLNREGWLSRETEASCQLTFADVVLLNKVDAAPEEQIAKAKKAISEINPSASIRETSFCDIPTESVLALRSYDLGHASSLSLESMKRLVEANKKAAESDNSSGSSSASSSSSARWSNGGSHVGREGATHSTRAITLIQPPNTTLNLTDLTQWLQQSVVKQHYRDLYRVKGILWVRPEVAVPTAQEGSGKQLEEEEEPPLPFVVHGVHSDIQGAFDEDLAMKAADAAASGAGATSDSSSSNSSRLRAEQTVFSPALVLIGKGTLLQSESKLRAKFEDLLSSVEVDEAEMKRHERAKAKARSGKNKAAQQEEGDCSCGHEHGHGHSHHHLHGVRADSPPAPTSSSTSRRRRAASGGKK
jgi:G3E family GTPase